MPQHNTLSRPSSQTQAVTQFMNRVYLWMSVGLLATFTTAFYTLKSPSLLSTLLKNPMLFFGLIIAQFVLVIVLSKKAKTFSAKTALMCFFSYTFLCGLTFSVILFQYTEQSVLGALMTCTGAFFGLSLFGFATQKDLTGVGTFCTMGLFGLVFMMILSFIFPGLMGHTALQHTISVVGLIVFSGLTAYDTQKIKQIGQSGQTSGNAALLGALTLYLDFINLFIFLLRLMGARR